MLIRVYKSSKNKLVWTEKDRLLEIYTNREIDLNLLKNKLENTFRRRIIIMINDLSPPRKVEQIFSLALQEAIDEANYKHLKLTFSVVNGSGFEIYRYVMPGALKISVELAGKKAKTSAFLKLATKDLKELTQLNGKLYNLESICPGEVVTFGGGIPLIDQQENVIVAIGVSGASDPLDDDYIAYQFLNKLKQYDIGIYRDIL